MFAATFGSTWAFVSIIGELSGTIAASLFVAATTLLDALIDYQTNARRHDALYRAYSDLKAEMTRTETITAQQVRIWKAQRIEIEKDEPTQLSVLNIMCHNEQAEADGYGPELRYKVSAYQAAFSQLLSLPPRHFQTIANLCSPVSGDR